MGSDEEQSYDLIPIFGVPDNGSSVYKCLISYKNLNSMRNNEWGIYKPKGKVLCATRFPQPAAHNRQVTIVAHNIEPENNQNVLSRTLPSTIPKVEKHKNSGRYWHEKNAEQAFCCQLRCLRFASCHWYKCVSETNQPAVVGVDGEGIGDSGTLDSMFAILVIG